LKLEITTTVKITKDERVLRFSLIGLVGFSLVYLLGSNFCFSSYLSLLKKNVCYDCCRIYIPYRSMSLFANLMYFLTHYRKQGIFWQSVCVENRSFSAIMENSILAV
jgi:cytochrome b subunit of formate dehydrogenase